MKNTTKLREHKTDGSPCWCNPKIISYKKKPFKKLKSSNFLNKANREQMPCG